MFRGDGSLRRIGLLVLLSGVLFRQVQALRPIARPIAATRIRSASSSGSFFQHRSPAAGADVRERFLVTHIRDRNRATFVQDRRWLSKLLTKEGNKSGDTPEPSGIDRIERRTSLLGTRLRKILGFPFRRLRRLLPRRGGLAVGDGDSGADEAPVGKESVPVDPIVEISEEIPPARVNDGRDGNAVVSSVEETHLSPGDDREEAGDDRWALSSPGVDLSGEWNLIVTDDFRKEYDAYLRGLGQPGFFRSVALSVVGMTTEETVQSDGGRALFIKGRNVRGVWERTLITSELGTPPPQPGAPFLPIKTPIALADGESAVAEAWWEQGGTVHRSWQRGVRNYGGGAFESLRYLESGGTTLVCETTFHPTDPDRERARVTWRFLRRGATR